MILKYTINRTRTSIIIILFLFQLITIVTPLDVSSDTLAEQTVSSSIPSISETDYPTTTNFSPPLLKLQLFQTPSILFIVHDESSPDLLLDEPFYDFMSINLSFNVIYHTANDSYNYTAFDVIVISKSVNDDSKIESLGSSTAIPILTMVASHYDEFSLGTGQGLTNNYARWILTSTPHYILDEEIVEVKTIYEQNGRTNYLEGYDASPFPSGCDVQQLAYHDSSSAPKYASLATLEKNGLGFDLKKTAERRAFWGASSTEFFLPETWSFWNKTLHWTLYDDYSGNATINVHVHDLYDIDISNANVELIDNNNISISWSENTSQIGLVTFTNISWGEYNVKASFRSIENITFTNLPIVPTRTYMRTYSFDYSIIMNVTTDDLPPIISNVNFDNSTSTFRATVTDDSSIKYVYLNLTAQNLSTGFPEIIPEINSTYFRMIEGIGDTYFNATCLESLNGIYDNITLTYNIIAEDITGNNISTTLQSFMLTDPVAPRVWSYESYDFGNGTITFSAYITDESGVQSPVKLDINEISYDMYQNETNLWVFSTNFNYNSFINYTIFSVSDIIGNENGSSVNPESFPYKNITTTDTIPPRISELGNPIADHDEGYVNFEVNVDETTNFQSDINSTMIFITLMINGENITRKMISLYDDIKYSYEHYFNYSDNVTFWINAYDNANNSIFSNPQGPYIIDDNAIPSVTFLAEQYGNGTINFFAQVLDWPNNDTSAQIFFTDDYAAVDWVNKSMNKLNSTTFQFTVDDFAYQTQSIWYYANALDSANNLHNTSIESARSLQLTDFIAPVIHLTFENSSTYDGEIILFAQATDPYGSISVLNNSISINISTILGNFSTSMAFYGGTTYSYSTSFADQTRLNITAYATDTNGNMGYTFLSILVSDKTPPTILQYGIENFANGTLTIFAEIVEGINGSGLLDDNSSVTLNYVYRTQFTEIMLWNGTGNYYSLAIPGLNPNDAVFYQFLLCDKSNNSLTTDWKQYFIADTVDPTIINFNATETQRDQIFSEILFWTNSIDEFGEIIEVILNYSLLLPKGWLNYSETMEQTGINYYEKQITVLSNSTIQYRIIVIDAFNNSDLTDFNLIVLTGFTPSQFGEDGYNYDINNPGQFKVWVMVNDCFDEHLHNVTITVIDLNTSAIILNNTKMNSEGLNYSISFEVDYLDQFSFSLVLTDIGVQNGFYDVTLRNSTVLTMLDYWNPTINEAGVNKVSDDTYLFWANVTDWGSGQDPHTLDVTLNYDLEAISGGGSQIGNNFEQKKMVFNETLFVTRITFNDSGTLIWSVNASDSSNLSGFHSGSNLPVVLPLISEGIDIEWVIAAVIVTSIAFLFFMSSVVTLRRRRTKKFARKTSFIEKLSFLSDIYTIMVCSSAGIPIWSITNVIYKSDETLNGNLSGLSVGIDSFLESFQSDFLTQVQESESPSSSQIEGNIKLSVIEQNKVQILIIGSNSYRIFVFLKEIPSIFIRKTFLKIIRELEHDLPLPDLGVVDENLQGPLVKSILNKNLPVCLLEPFKIDLDKLSEYDERMKSEKVISGLTRNGVNVLKVLSISHLVQISSKKQNKQSLLKLFNKTYLSASQLYSGALLYKDAMNLLNNIFVFTPEELYEAFWIGISEKVKILIPAGRN